MLFFFRFLRPPSSSTEKAKKWMKFFNFFEITTLKCQFQLNWLKKLFLNEYMTGMDVSTAISTAKKCRPIIDPIGNSDILKILFHIELI